MKEKIILASANLLVFVVGIIHLITHFFSEFTGSSVEQQEVIQKIKTVDFEMPGGQWRTIEDINSGYGLTWALLLITLSALGFLTNGSQRFYFILALGCLEVCFVMLYFLIAPPAIMLGVAAISYAVYGLRLNSGKVVSAT